MPQQGLTAQNRLQNAAKHIFLKGGAPEVADAGTLKMPHLNGSTYPALRDRTAWAHRPAAAGRTED